MKLTRRVWSLLAVLVFALSFSVHVAAIRLFPQYDHHDDIEIYRASGALIVRGVNPYDFSDGLPVRTFLREQSPNPDIRNLSQARWNYYASSNLPVNLLFFGALSAISDTPRFHRYAYGFFDSLLSVLVVWFVLRHWPLTSSNLVRLLSRAGMTPTAALFAERLGAGLLLGCFSPILFKYGGAIPEDKGIQILLMLAAIACSLSSEERIWYWGGALLLGLSIAFKGLGIFLVPLFAMRLLAKREGLWRKTILFAAVCGAVAGVWAIPFGWSVATMVGTRLMLGSTLHPQHASMWVIPSVYLPSAWNALRLGSVLALLGASLIAYWRKLISIDILCMTFLLGFVVVWLINGSLDRQNIALLLVILLLGTRSPKAAFVCLLPYLLAGIGGFVTRGLDGEPVNFAVREILESLGVLLFAVVYGAMLGWISLSSRTWSLAPPPATGTPAN